MSMVVTATGHPSVRQLVRLPRSGHLRVPQTGLPHRRALQLDRLLQQGNRLQILWDQGEPGTVADLVSAEEEVVETEAVLVAERAAAEAGAAGEEDGGNYFISLI